MKTLKEFLKKHEACEEGYLFAKDLTLEQFLDTCEKGDWILWLFNKSNPKDKRLRTLVAGHCANTVRHLMKDERSRKAVDVAIKYGEGKATIQQLEIATSAAHAAAYTSAYTTDADAYAASAAYAYAAYAAHAYDDIYVYASTSASLAAAFASTKTNEKLTADICRKYLPIELWNIN